MFRFDFTQTIYLVKYFFICKILIKKDKKMVKKRVAMTTIYTNNYVFPQEYIGSMSAIQQIRELTNY